MNTSREAIMQDLPSNEVIEITDLLDGMTIEHKQGDIIEVDETMDIEYTSEEQQDDIMDIHEDTDTDEHMDIDEVTNIEEHMDIDEVTDIDEHMDVEYTGSSSVKSSKSGSYRSYRQRQQQKRKYLKKNAAHRS